jgi:hypothetical protein
MRAFGPHQRKNENGRRKTRGKAGTIRGWKLEVRGGVFEEISDADFSQSY